MSTFPESEVDHVCRLKQCRVIDIFACKHNWSCPIDQRHRCDENTATKKPIIVISIISNTKIVLPCIYCQIVMMFYIILAHSISLSQIFLSLIQNVAKREHVVVHSSNHLLLSVLYFDLLVWLISIIYHVDLMWLFTNVFAHANKNQLYQELLDFVDNTLSMNYSLLSHVCISICLDKP